jgi:hypothetical protein
MDFVDILLLFSLVLIIVAVYYVIKGDRRYFGFVVASFICSMIAIFMPQSKQNPGIFMDGFAESLEDPISFISNIFDDGSDNPKNMDGGKKRRRRR